MQEFDDKESHFLTRREWRAWLIDVYDYRHSILAREIRELKSAVDVLAKATSEMSGSQHIIANTARTIEKINNKRIYIIFSILLALGPIVAIVDLVYRVTRGI